MPLGRGRGTISHCRKLDRKLGRSDPPTLSACGVQSQWKQRLSLSPDRRGVRTSGAVFLGMLMTARASRDAHRRNVMMQAVALNELCRALGAPQIMETVLQLGTRLNK